MEAAIAGVTVAVFLIVFAPRGANNSLPPPSPATLPDPLAASSPDSVDQNEGFDLEEFRARKARWRCGVDACVLLVIAALAARVALQDYGGALSPDLQWLGGNFFGREQNLLQQLAAGLARLRLDVQSFLRGAT